MGLPTDSYAWLSMHARMKKKKERTRQIYITFDLGLEVIRMHAAATAPSSFGLAKPRSSCHSFAFTNKRDNHAGRLATFRLTCRVIGLASN